MSYAEEKLSNAVAALAGSAAPIQKRLEYAFTAMHTLTDRDFSDPDQRAAWHKVVEALTADKSDPEAGHVPTTTSRLSDEDASQIAREIVDLESMLRLEK